ncbi:MAG: CapA family protein, partial [Clostridia bacterium]|nr:CapA family protein [Clostridia bacterium]
QNITNYGSNGKSTVRISVAGDITFDPERPVMVHAGENGGVLNCFDKSLIRQLKASDVFLLNCETAISESGEPIADKAWTFCSKPESIGFLKELGVDVVSLANNHVYDYGEVAFEDTMQNLKNAGMPYVGAGMNLVEAVNGHYFIVNGIKIGIVAASRAEKYYMTPVATFASPGIMGTYDSEDFLESIKIAEKNCDFLIAYVHWGTEYSKELDEAQKTMSREYIEAGADAVIGAHPHCLQGMEFYNGVPVIYSLGNFWFNDKTLDSGVVTLEIDGDLNAKVMFTPLLQDNCETRLVTKRKERRALFDRIESYEPQGVVISNDGEVTSRLIAEP